MKTYIIFNLCLLILISCKPSIKTNKEIEQAFLALDKELLQKELKQMTDNDQFYRSLLDSLYQTGKQPPQKEWDSLWNLQKQIDNQNTQRLLELTEKYGFPDPQRSGKPIPIWLIFQHADDKYCDQLMPLLDRELEAKRLTAAEHHMIQWNLEGRQGMPLKIITQN
ncbi:hypothetical protein [uncultured Aquimarina sp.]|uniref:hypothetical protein n=1 Tax=uncultured Aquimarina sp. TaxID=575652 RepID=UPI00262F98D6|nr:hypothetical protein [uncultured Aquimarina sp.]